MINKSTYFINELSPCIDLFFQNCGSGLLIYEKCHHKFIYETLTHFSPVSLKWVKFRCIPSSFLLLNAETLGLQIYKYRKKYSKKLFQRWTDPRLP